VDVTGAGFVLFVILDVNSVKFPMVEADKFCTPLTIEAAKSDPGRCGNEVVVGMGEGDGFAPGVPEDMGLGV